MSKMCEISGKKAMTGNNVSHANNKTKEDFYPIFKMLSFLAKL